jgi:hypothetical protein
MFNNSIDKMEFFNGSEFASIKLHFTDNFDTTRTKIYYIEF